MPLTRPAVCVTFPTETGDRIVIEALEPCPVSAWTRNAESGCLCLRAATDAEIAEARAWLEVNRTWLTTWLPIVQRVPLG